MYSALTPAVSRHPQRPRRIMLPTLLLHSLLRKDIAGSEKNLQGFSLGGCGRVWADKLLC